MLELALYLAANPRPVSRKRIAADLSDGRARLSEASVKVYIHRLRTIVGKETIVRRAHGYAYSDVVHIDLPAIESFVAEACDGVQTGPAMRARARMFFTQVSAGRSDIVLAWKWFEPVEARLRCVQSRLSEISRQL